MRSATQACAGGSSPPLRPRRASRMQAASGRATVSDDRQSIPRPVFRNLRVFAVDPGLTARFETAVMNETTLRIPWEELEKGPSGEYVVVVDADERGTRLHLPVDLDSSEVLAEGGLPPSDGNPQFRQQMVYAVAMRTIKNFERALGRMVHWPAAKSNGAYRGQLCLY